MSTTSSIGTNHLHFGGSLNPKSGRLGPKPSQGTAFKKQKRFETIVRLENAGIGEAAAAAMLCISVPRLRFIKKNPDYLNARMRITHGIILDHDSSLSQIREQRKEMLTQMLPPALQVLANELLQPAHTLAERKHKVEVARDLLDREGTFAKVSRTEVKPVDHFDFEHADKASSEILAVIKGTAPAACGGRAVSGQKTDVASETTTESGLAAAEAFSNTSKTLSAIDQQLALSKLEEEATEAGVQLAGMPVASELEQ